MGNAFLGILSLSKKFDSDFIDLSSRCPSLWLSICKFFRGMSIGVRPQKLNSLLPNMSTAYGLVSKSLTVLLYLTMSSYSFAQPKDCQAHLESPATIALGDLLIARASTSKPGRFTPLLVDAQKPLTPEQQNEYQQQLSQEERTSIFYYLLDHPDTLLGRLMSDLKGIPFVSVSLSKPEKQRPRIVNHPTKIYDLKSNSLDDPKNIFADNENFIHAASGTIYTMHSESHSGTDSYTMAFLRRFIRTEAKTKLNVLFAMSRLERNKTHKVEFKVYKPGTMHYQKMKILIPIEKFGPYNYVIPRTKPRFMEFGDFYARDFKALESKSLPDLSHLEAFFTWLFESPARVNYAIELIHRANPIFKQIEKNDLKPSPESQVLFAEQPGLVKSALSVIKPDWNDRIRNSKLDIAHTMLALPPREGRFSFALKPKSIEFIALDQQIIRDNAVLIAKTFPEFYETATDYYGSLEDIKNIMTYGLIELSDMQERTMSFLNSISLRIDQINYKISSSNKRSQNRAYVDEIEKLQAEVIAIDQERSALKILLELIEKRIAHVKAAQINHNLDKSDQEKYELYKAHFFDYNSVYQDKKASLATNIDKQIEVIKTKINAARSSLISRL